MAPMTIVASLFNLVLAVEAQHGHGSSGSSIPDSGEVDAAIVNIDFHYTEKLCLELLLVDCSTHVTQGDEKICGSDGVTYENHCKFAHAKCEFGSYPTPLSVVNHGPCAQTASSTTPYPQSSVLQSVFCQYVDTVHCGSSIEIKCGSDGKLYVNQCELLKAKCKDPTLAAADRSSCP